MTPHASGLSFDVARKHAFLGLMILGLACRAPAMLSAGRTSSDLALFREVALAIKEHVRPDPLAIDPLPLIADPAVLSHRNNTRAAISAKELDARRGVLHDLGIPEISDDGDWGNCPGVMVPPPPPPGIDRKKTGCPKSRSFAVTVGLPRAGGAYLPPPGAVDQREIDKGKGYVAVRALITFRGPEGMSMTAYDFVMARDPSGWKVVKKVGLWDVE
jgi:hypothetical protein